MSDQTIAAVAAGNPYLKVIIIDDEADSIAESMGISKEREKELDALIQEHGSKEETITGIFANVSKHVKHANELAYCIFHVGSFMGSNRVLKDLAKSVMSSKDSSTQSSED